MTRPVILNHLSLTETLLRAVEYIFSLMKVAKGSGVENAIPVTPPPPPHTHMTVPYTWEIYLLLKHTVDPDRMQLTDVQFLVILLFTLW
jgi:hypothetical protein